MKCPFCNHPDTQVVETRESEDGGFIRRRRRCGGCDKRFTTYERPEVSFPTVVKRDGRRIEYERAKLQGSFQIALRKRPVSTEQIDAATDSGEDDSFDAYNEAGNLRAMVERFCAREGHYPSRILADKIYRNRENLSYCKERGIRLSGPALGRPRKDEIQDKAQNYLDECERVEVERRFSLAKRKCGMGLVTAKLQETAAHVIAMSVLVLNLRKIQCALLQILAMLRGTWILQRKLVFVQ